MTFWFLAVAFIIFLVVLGIGEWRDHREAMNALREALRWDEIDDLVMDAHLKRFGGPYDWSRTGDFDGD